MTNEQVLLDRIEQVRRYAKSVQFHSREDCTELVPTNGCNICNCGLRTVQAKFDYILDILDGVEERNRYRYRGAPSWLPPKVDDDGMPTTQEIAGIGGWG